MRILIAAAAVLLTTGLASAQENGQPAQPAAPVPPSSCGALPTLPTLSDGATATPEAMQGTQTAITAADPAYRANLECRRREVDALIAQLQARRDEFNAGATNLNSLAERWQAEIDEFNAREPRRRNR